MKFTDEEAAWLRAALDGKTVQYRKKANSFGWTTANSFFEDIIAMTSLDYEVRIKPDVIIVNGIEVPAPTKERLADGEAFYVPDTTSEDYYLPAWWSGSVFDVRALARGQVHLDAYSAAAHGKAQAAHKPG